MRWDIENLKTGEELENELMALKLKIALREYQEEAFKRMASEEGVSEKEHIVGGHDQMIRMIDRQIRKTQLRQFAKKTLPRIGKVAACLLLTFYIGLSVAVAAVESVRVELARFILRVEERYTSFGFESTDEYVEIPADWLGYYYPTYIPDGYKISKTFSEEIEYTGPNQEILAFGEYGVDTYGTIDTEDAIINTITIHGNNAMLVEKGEWTTIIWNVDHHCLIVESTGAKEEAIKIAESVAMIRE